MNEENDKFKIKKWINYPDVVRGQRSSESRETKEAKLHIHTLLCNVCLFVFVFCFYFRFHSYTILSVLGCILAVLYPRDHDRAIVNKLTQSINQTMFVVFCHRISLWPHFLLLFAFLQGVP